LVRASTALGDFQLTVCTDGTFLLDGGAMFGVVPKTLWQKRIPANDDNEILLGLNSVAVRTGNRTVLIETGIGNKLAPKMRQIFENQELLPRSLAAAGIHPDAVDIVINTHLHFDHCGWNTTLQPDGSVTPTFKNARYFAHAGEVAHGHLQLERDRVSYNSPNYDPLVASGQMTLLELAGVGATAEICEGVSVELFPGHTMQMMGVHIEPPRPVESRPSGGRAPHACYIGDLIPTAHHLDPAWVMGYDLDPLRCIEERKRFYARAIPEQWLVLFTHDHDTPMAQLVLNAKGKPVLGKS
jgi:glyoxylase-like metal-dependent hydrolase (beta-lactamase superfamily II)